MSAANKSPGRIIFIVCVVFLAVVLSGVLIWACSGERVKVSVQTVPPVSGVKLVYDNKTVAVTNDNGEASAILSHWKKSERVRFSHLNLGFDPSEIGDSLIRIGGSQPVQVTYGSKASLLVKVLNQDSTGVPGQLVQLLPIITQGTSASDTARTDSSGFATFPLQGKALRDSCLIHVRPLPGACVLSDRGERKVTFPEPETGRETVFVSVICYGGPEPTVPPLVPPETTADVEVWVHAANGAPMSNIEVNLQGGGIYSHGQTGKNGRFLFQDGALAVGSHYVIVAHLPGASQKEHPFMLTQTHGQVEGITVAAMCNVRVIATENSARISLSRDGQVVRQGNGSLEAVVEQGLYRVRAVGTATVELPLPLLTATAMEQIDTRDCWLLYSIRLSSDPSFPLTEDARALLRCARNSDRTDNKKSAMVEMARLAYNERQYDDAFRTYESLSEEIPTAMADPVICTYGVESFTQYTLAHLDDPNPEKSLDRVVRWAETAWAGRGGIPGDTLRQCRILSAQANLLLAQYWYFAKRGYRNESQKASIRGKATELLTDKVMDTYRCCDQPDARRQRLCDPMRTLQKYFGDQTHSGSKATGSE